MTLCCIIFSHCKDVEKLKPSYIAGRNEMYSYSGKWFGSASKVK